MSVFRVSEAGRILRTQGVDGTIQLHVNHQIKELSPWQALFLWNNGVWVPFFIQEVDMVEEGEYLIKLEGLETREEAAGYVNKPFALASDQVGGSIEEESILVDWVVRDQDGKLIGSVVSVSDMGEYLLLEIDHQGKDLLIPLHDDLLIQSDENEQVLTLRIPDGLVEE